LPRDGQFDVYEARVSKKEYPNNPPLTYKEAYDVAAKTGVLPGISRQRFDELVRSGELFAPSDNEYWTVVALYWRPEGADRHDLERVQKLYEGVHIAE
jgi:hypothetical protein